MATLARSAAVFNLAAPGAATNILTTSLTPNHNGSSWHIFVQVATSTVLNHMMVDSTGSPVTVTAALNGGVALLAGKEYEFWATAVKSPTAGTNTAPIKHNFQVVTDSVINFLIVDEITSA